MANELVPETEPVTVFAITAIGNPLPLTAPASGVITKWNVNVVPTPVSIPQATNASGAPTVTTLKAKLKGQAKAKRKRSKGKRG